MWIWKLSNSNLIVMERLGDQILLISAKSTPAHRMFIIFLKKTGTPFASITN